MFFWTLERVSKLIEFYPLPVVKSQPAYLKESDDTIKKIENIRLPQVQDIILASFDVVFMFTSAWSVPQNQAFQTTLATLANLCPFGYDSIMPDKEYVAEIFRYRNV